MKVEHVGLGVLPRRARDADARVEFAQGQVARGPERLARVGLEVKGQPHRVPLPRRFVRR